MSVGIARLVTVYLLEFPKIAVVNHDPLTIDTAPRGVDEEVRHGQVAVDGSVISQKETQCPGDFTETVPLLVGGQAIKI